MAGLYHPFVSPSLSRVHIAQNFLLGIWAFFVLFNFFYLLHSFVRAIMAIVVEPGAVSSQLQLQTPLETKHWLVLKEGFLQKTKTVKGFHKSTKLRWFVLKQDPIKLEARLEYYEGMLFRGSAALKGAVVKPSKNQGHFEVRTPKRTRVPTRTFYLAVDGHDIAEATTWVLALQQAISAPLKASGETPLKATPKPRPSASSSKKKSSSSVSSLEPVRPVPLPPTTANQAKATTDEAEEGAKDSNDVTGDNDAFAAEENINGPQRIAGELDGYAIDDARWAALRKRNDSAIGVPDQAALELDEDVLELRRLEEEEERRQEEERLAFLAEREARARRASVQKEKEEEEAAAAAAAAAAAEAGEEKPDQGDVSEDEWDMEEEMRLMALAEAEEEARQERERLEFLAEREAKKKAAAEATTTN